MLKLPSGCLDSGQLQVSNSDGSRIESIIEASKTRNDNFHLEVQTKLKNDPSYQGKYHKKCVTKYLTAARRLSGKQKRTQVLSDAPFIPDKKIRTRTSFFNCMQQCLYCGQLCEVVANPKHPPDRWRPAYLVRETREKARCSCAWWYQIVQENDLFQD